MGRKLLIITILFITWGTNSAQDQVAYIRKYEEIAVAEMMRSGIPASIKLAQAILESNCGQSELACKANNHFGIKCGGNWDGKTFHREDDDYHNGKLTKSCFREFNSVMESYVAHSDFLKDPGKTSRYSSLFDLEKTDYKGWAQGLSKAGYATDPQYANRLIQIIEKYELYRYDNEYVHELVASANQPTINVHQIIRQVNNVNYTVALGGDNLLLVAARNNMSARELMRYNEGIRNKEQVLASGDRIFLEAKRSSYKGKQQYHMLKEGEDLATVSNLYGVKLETLAKRNGLNKTEVPLPRQKIVLKGKSKKELKTANPYEIPGSTKPKTPTTTPPTKQPKVNNTNDAVASTTTKQDVGNNVSKYVGEMHTVVKGDTLYGIARSYGLSVSELKQKNSLNVDTIYIGQKLVWK